MNQHTTRRFGAAAFVLLAVGGGGAFAQSNEFQLDDETGWVQTAAPEPGTDAWTMAQARRHLAAENPERALKILSPWLEANKRTSNPYLAEAYLLRGDARVANDDEYDALFDYETVIRDFSASDSFPKAIEREYEIGVRYINGLRRKFLGMRVEGARATGEELLIRVQERAPGSLLSEKAALDLADHYYRRREMPLAGEMYDIFIENYPDSEYRQYAELRQIKANLSRFKGPEYDAAGLIEARLLIEDFIRRRPGAAQHEGITSGMLVRIDESAAQQLLTTAKWYLKRKDEASARFTLRRLLKRHPTSAAARDTIDLMIARGWMDPPEEHTTDRHGEALRKAHAEPRGEPALEAESAPEPTLEPELEPIPEPEREPEASSPDVVPIEELP